MARLDLALAKLASFTLCHSQLALLLQPHAYELGSASGLCPSALGAPLHLFMLLSYPAFSALLPTFPHTHTLFGSLLLILYISVYLEINPHATSKDDFLRLPFIQR